MTDIVERLQRPLVAGLTHPADEERREAADEIERLRADRDHWREVAKQRWIGKVELLAALERYGLHTWDCANNDTLGKEPCNCGWDKWTAIAKARQT